MDKKLSKYNGTIVDGEFIYLPKHNRHLYLIFDCLRKGEEDIGKIQSLMERLQHADEIIKNCFVIGKQNTPENLQYSGEFDINKVIEFYGKSLEKYMEKLNQDILIEKKFTTKYRLAV